MFLGIGYLLGGSHLLLPIRSNLDTFPLLDDEELDDELEDELDEEELDELDVVVVVTVVVDLENNVSNGSESSHITPS